MRLTLALFLLIALCVSGNAAPRTHHGKSRQVIIRPGQAAPPVYVSPNGTRVYRDNTAPGGFRTDRDPPVSYDDPSKFGGA